MNHLITYLLKVILCSGIFYCYYLLALRNKSFHPYNRFYLLSTAIMSAILPLLHISMFDFSSDNAQMLALFQMLGSGQLPDVVIGNTPKPVNWEQIGILTSLSISFILIVLMAIRIAKVFHLKRRFPRRTVDNINFINTNIEQAPFSFLNNLFWRKDISLSDKIGEQIYRHEMAHIRQKHSLDKILFQVLNAIFWMNPVYYYMQRELLLIHEFMADQKAIEAGDGEAFARMLLATQFGSFQFEPAHSLSYSSIKKRLHMITNSHKPKYSYLRRLLFLPLLFTVTFVFALRAHQNQMAEQKADLQVMVAEQQAAREVKTDSQPVDKVLFTGKDSSKPNKINFHPLVDSAGNQAKPLIIIDGKEQSADKSIDDIDPSTIEKVYVYKEKYANGKFGAKGKNGVVQIVTKAAAAKSGKTNMDPVTIVGYRVDSHVTQEAQKNKVEVGSQTPAAAKAGQSLSAHKMALGEGDQKPLIMLDGKKISDEEMKAVSPNEIEHISVLKDKTGLEKYGEEGKNGVLLITSKTAAQKQKANPIEFTSVQQEPTYPGGTFGWRKYLERNLQPSIPVKNGAPEGTYTVIVSFLVNKKGEVSEIQPIQKPEKDYGTAEESVRVIKESGNWIPAKQNGRVVSYRTKQKIVFQIAK